MNRFKNIFRHLWRDKVSLSMFIFTIVFAITKNPDFLYMLILFVFRGIMWEGQYVDALDKYVTDPEFRKKLGFPNTKIKKDALDNIFDILFMLIVAGVAALIIFK